MRRLIGPTALFLLFLLGALGDAFALDITAPFNFLDVRGPNPFGFGTATRDNFGASVTPNPSSMPPFSPTVTATQGTTKITLPFEATMFGPTTFNPNEYFGFIIPFDPALTGSWTITATLDSTSKSLLTNPIPHPQELPFLENLTIVGMGLTPTLTWTLPNLMGFDADRIRVRAIDLSTPLHDQFFQATVQDFMMEMTPTATSFTIPPGVLQFGRSYGFSVLLEDRVFGDPTFGTFVENRSRVFTQMEYSPVPEPASLLLLGSGLAGLGAVARRRLHRKLAGRGQ